MRMPPPTTPAMSQPENTEWPYAGGHTKINVRIVNGDNTFGGFTGSSRSDNQYQRGKVRHCHMAASRLRHYATISRAIRHVFADRCRRERRRWPLYDAAVDAGHATPRAITPPRRYKPAVLRHIRSLCPGQYTLHWREWNGGSRIVPNTQAK